MSARLDRAVPWLLALAVVLVYAPSLDAGWLGLDDDWLVRDNPYLERPTGAALAAIWGDLSRTTRLVLGAEYLPVRDTSHWLEASIAGVSAGVARGVSLAIYIGAVLLAREWLLRAFPSSSLTAELAAWLFALHPVHVESAAWIAGRKDVLALFFVAAALLAHRALDPRARRLAVPILTLLACLSKSMAVVVPALLVADDWLARRRPDPIELGASALAAAGALAVHLHVGSSVGMLAPLPGGSRAAAFATMGPVVLRYLGLSLGVVPGSIAYEVPERSALDPVGLGAWAFVCALGVAAALIARRGDRVPAFALAWLGIALAPVSQVLAPLQNLMADRYLVVAVLGPCVLVGWGIAEIASRGARPGLVRGLAASLVIGASALALLRVQSFADPELLWTEASERAPSRPLGPYQLGTLHQERGELDRAEAAFREALRRDAMRTDAGRRSANNLAILLARSERTDEATTLLERAVERYPHDPRVRHNLAILLDPRDPERARALREEVERRFPDYRPGDPRAGPLRGRTPQSP